jgi:hypothetical protein
MEDVAAIAPVPSCLPVEVAKLTDLRFVSFVSMVRAERSIDLLMLTNEPLSPVALVKILTVTPWLFVPPKTASTWDAELKRLTPLNVVSLI